jgi:hypothetical protein
MIFTRAKLPQTFAGAKSRGIDNFQWNEPRMQTTGAAGPGIVTHVLIGMASSSSSIARLSPAAGSQTGADIKAARYARIKIGDPLSKEKLEMIGGWSTAGADGRRECGRPEGPSTESGAAGNLHGIEVRMIRAAR